MSDNTPTPPPKHVYFQQLRQKMQPYAEHWTDFVESDKFFLSGKERQVLAYIMTFQSVKICARDMELSEGYVRSILRNIIRRLDMNQRYYDEFLAEKALQEDLGIQQPDDDLQRFLNTHLFGVDLSQDVVNHLFAAECFTIGDVVQKLSVAKMLHMRGFGQVKVDKVKAVLKAHHCLHLLK